MSARTTIPPRPRGTRASGPRPTGRLARIRRVAEQLTPDTIEQIAQRVAQLLRHEPDSVDDGPNKPPELIDAEESRKALPTHPWICLRKRRQARCHPTQRRATTAPALRPPSCRASAPEPTAPQRAGSGKRHASRTTDATPPHALNGTATPHPRTTRSRVLHPPASGTPKTR